MTTVIIEGDGDQCPRCGRATQIREHDAITPAMKERIHYTRWFVCINEHCLTKQVMPPRFQVRPRDGRSPWKRENRLERPWDHPKE